MTDNPTSSASTSPHNHEVDGRFAKGNRGGPGNPFARQTAALRAALMKVVSEQDIMDIAVKLRDDAKAGDKAATKLLFQYVIGKPQPAVDPDTLDVQEMRGYLSATFPPEVLEEMQRGMPLSLLLKLWPTYLDVQERTNVDFCGRQLDKIDEKEQRRQERAARKAERQRRREARRHPPQNMPPTPITSPHPGATHNGEQIDAPSTNGFFDAGRSRDPHNGPSTNGEIRSLADFFARWIDGAKRTPPNGDARP